MGAGAAAAERAAVTTEAALTSAAAEAGIRAGADVIDWRAALSSLYTAAEHFSWVVYAP